jgi:NAD(P)-dependent dehydrogenase (short-subunit alcohol dehydrogenase family)
MQAALRHMMAQKSGAIVCITGTGGKMPIAIHMPGGSVNAALNLIVRGLANQFGKDGIRINAVSPGRIRSPRQDQMLSVGAAADDPAREFPLRRFGEPGEVSDAVLFLASDRASYVTGHVLNVDGGSVMTL